MIFWVSFIALLVVLFEMRKEPGGEDVEVEGPAFTRFLFGNTRAGLFWLPIRLFVGFTWLEAGYHKFSGTGWLDGGSALQGYWTHAVAIPAAGPGSPAITFDWYRDFLQTLLDNQAYTWFAPLIAFGELAIGVGLILGVPDRHRSLLRGDHEHVLPARRLGLHQPGPVHPRHRPDPGLEGRRLLRPRPLRPPAAGHALASRTRSAGRHPDDTSRGPGAGRPRYHLPPARPGFHTTRVFFPGRARLQESGRGVSSALAAQGAGRLVGGGLLGSVIRCRRS